MVTDLDFKTAASGLLNQREQPPTRPIWPERAMATADFESYGPMMDDHELVACFPTIHHDSRSKWSPTSGPRRFL